MSRILTSLLLMAVFVAGQDIPGLDRLIERQISRNVKTAALDPGKDQKISLSLRPQTIGSDVVFVGIMDPAIKVSMHLPNGTVIDPSSAAGNGFQWEASRGDDFSFLSACKSATTWITITLPPGQPVGEYIIAAQAPKGGSRTNVCATYLSLGMGREGEDYETVGDSVKTDQEYYQLGDPVTISVPVLDGGQPVRNARVDAVVSYQDNVVVTGEAGRLQLTDTKGDGNYTGVFKPEKPAMYNIMVTISGRKQRESGSFHVEPLNARLLSATLTNPAGHPQARMRFQIYTMGEYTVNPTIRSANGKSDNASIRVDLTPGEHVVTWEPSPGELQVLEMAPPYELVGVHVLKKNAAAQFGSDVVGTWRYQAGQWKPK